MTLRDCALVTALGLGTMLPYLGQTRDVAPHEMRHAEVAREMLVRRDFLVPHLLGQEYDDKPAVLHVAIAAAYAAAGHASLALARLPSVLAAIAGALALYGVGLVLADRPTALLAAFACLGTFEYWHMAHVARPDMLFTAASLGACLAAARALAASDARRATLFALAGALAGLALVTKGPVGVAVPTAFTLLAPIRRGDLRAPRPRDALAGAAGLVAAVATWAVPAWLRDHGGYLHRVLVQPDLSGESSTSRAPWWYVGVLAAGGLPVTLFLPAVVADVRRRRWSPAVAVVVVLLVALTLVPKKRPHYLLPLYPFVALAVAAAVRGATRPWVARLAAALVAGSMMTGALYYAFPLPHVIQVEPEVVVARRVLATAPRGDRLVGVGEVAETLAFLGEREDVVEVGDARELVRAVPEPGAWVLLPAEQRAQVVRGSAGHLALTEVFTETLPGHNRARGWALYRARPTPPGA